MTASWAGTGGSQAVLKAVERGEKRGVLFVAAAGNEGSARLDFPASADGVISVGATTPADILASFSNRGALVAAPGVGVLSTTSPGQYQRRDGTSMASAHVAGVAGRLGGGPPAPAGAAGR